MSAGRAPNDEAASADFWAVYEASFEALQRATLNRAVKHPELAPIATKTIMAADLPTDDEKWKQRIADAALGSWSGYEAVLRERGAFYARAGVSFRGWYDVVSQLPNQLVPLLVAAYGDDRARLSAAITAAQSFGDRVMGTLVEAYLETTRKLVTGAEARNQAVLGAALDPILVVDAGGVVLDTNAAMTAVFGYERGEIIGGPLMRLLGTEEAAAAYAAALREHPAGRSALTIGHRKETSGRRKDGSIVPLEIGIVPTEDVDGTPTFTVFLRDASERYRMEQMGRVGVALSAQNLEIREGSRLKSEFLANMSHELRTPLNSIIGFTELLHDGEVAVTSPEHDEFLGDILRSARHLLQLINDILDLSKVEAGKLTFQPERIDLPALAAEIIASLRPWASARGVAVHLQVAEDLGPLQLDAGRLRQVLYNYLSNALKFTAEGGAVTVRAFAAGAEAMTLEVEDTGIGIDPAEVSRLFVKFEQLDSGASKHHAGTGLGLALTKRLAEAQGGSVAVRSVLGQGSVFSVTLPRETAGDADAAARPAQRPPVGPLRVLVVEDDARDEAAIVEALRDVGYAVDTASSGGEAITRCLNARYDAITLDLVLPGTSGLEVLARIRRGGPSAHARIIMVSRDLGQGSARAFRVDEALSKPLDAPALLAALARSGVGPPTIGQGEILVVDDDRASAKLVGLALVNAGFGVAVEHDAESALARTMLTLPRAVVLDLQMPRVDGFEFLRRFRSHAANAHVPVLVWTVRDLTAAERRRLMSSAQSVLAKGGKSETSALLAQLRSLLPRAEDRRVSHAG